MLVDRGSADKLDGVAIRVPTPNVSVVDLTFEASRETAMRVALKSASPAEADAQLGAARSRRDVDALVPPILVGHGTTDDDAQETRDAIQEIEEAFREVDYELEERRGASKAAPAEGRRRGRRRQSAKRIER